jgi:hypothetical protein
MEIRQMTPAQQTAKLIEKHLQSIQETLDKITKGESVSEQDIESITWHPGPISTGLAKLRNQVASQ